jgi:hypothetical protein
MHLMPTPAALPAEEHRQELVDHFIGDQDAAAAGSHWADVFGANAIGPEHRSQAERDGANR